MHRCQANPCGMSWLITLAGNSHALALRADGTVVGLGVKLLLAKTEAGGRRTLPLTIG